ncbi:alpha/beta fold hydrolase [Flavobacterium sp.]|uniref:alpha/beta fold hydrolase n=1 Tax=Flavobacterium sp. TaxID=239 RepID=UPI003D0CD6FC
MSKLIYLLFTKTLGLYLNILSFLFPKKALTLTYALFTQPREGKLKKEKLPKILAESIQETHICGELFFQSYRWEGNATTILLVHGWESNTSRWELLLPYLKKSGSTIIALDAPAHGLSGGTHFSIPLYADFIHVVVQKFQPQYAVGHSLGGKTCLYYQHAFPQNPIEKMVILGAPSELKIILRNFFNLLSLNQKLALALENFYSQTYKVKLEDFSGHKFIANSNIKGFVAHDLNDPRVAFEEGLKIAAAWQNAVFYPTKDLGHSLHDDELYQVVCAFLFD